MEPLDLVRQLLPYTKSLCLGYCNEKIFKKLHSPLSSIPIIIKYIIACFVQQKDSFVCAKNAIGQYNISNFNQTAFVNEYSEEMRRNDESIWRKIFSKNLIDCQYELSQIQKCNEILFIWELQIETFPGIAFSDVLTPAMLVGIVDLDDINSDTSDKIYYGISEYGTAIREGPSRLWGYHTFWEHKIKTKDVIKIEVQLINREYDQGIVKFYKNNLLSLQYDGINIKSNYRMFVSMNSHLSGCTIIQFQCQIS